MCAMWPGLTPGVIVLRGDFNDADQLNCINAAFPPNVLILNTNRISLLCLTKYKQTHRCVNCQLLVPWTKGITCTFVVPLDITRETVLNYQLPIVGIGWHFHYFLSWDLTLLAHFYLMVDPAINRIPLLIATSATHIVSWGLLSFLAKLLTLKINLFCPEAHNLVLLILLKSCFNVDKGSVFGGSHDHLYDHWHSCHLIKDRYIHLVSIGTSQ